ncbi:MULTISPECIES: methionyl-tRNA formyltransferase [unclassified Synechococcus]|uniref:methionyl-tRNA formyltransferase n=2 Tax=Synechococcaceae TaxID=1890426 RepID=UPI0008FF4F63|nr:MULTISPECIES: methionyl-tRNA formyltransferase [unclassified Synechococcus]MCT4365128.1 methionyl-tRNA formyltransferase [Candidatus Regnicoccus frigidus MAG-AL1]APD47285.1 methionyl-tRNA formyltransferase [Synechococcus sp. SynAce01]MCT0202059.1 methionyl-tRNA formyltransferase [Synechococcus sp. CS-603]MCT0244837.1 methionyl-tRNA formyltransferase [Synechococcus sp. CS-601]TWB88717.1 methionyl-tRNA formyltransferase [Synechococcus sp. Ace-Pa]
MRILFWGTPAYAVPSLDALVAAGHELVAVVSQPDRRRGRGSAFLPSAVKARALELGLPVFTPQRIRREAELQVQLAALGADISVVVAFGQILPPAVLNEPPLGCWNGHGSLLPRWRGAAPIQWSLLEGDAETGVGIMAMEEGLDTGPVLLEKRLTIGLLENAQQLALRLSKLTAELLVAAMPLIEKAGAGPEAERLARLEVRPQPSANECYARLLAKKDFRINWSASALTLHRQVMGLYPGAHSIWGEKRLKLLVSEPLVARLVDQLSSQAAQLAQAWNNRDSSSRPTEQPGTVLEVVPSLGLVVSTGGCPLLIREAQLEGKAPARGQALLQQLGAKAGDRL